MSGGINNALPGDYITGFVDGEGCFALKFRRDIRHERKSIPSYFYWNAEFAICLRMDDKEILQKIKSTLGCGRITLDARRCVRYAVSDINDLVEKTIPFINRNKRKEVNVIKGKVGFQKTIWDEDDLIKLSEIHSKMTLYKGTQSRSKWKGKSINKP